MLTFSVQGPFEVPRYQGKAATSFSAKEGREFWGQYPKWAKECGGYVFAVRAGKGFTPVYVGQTTKSFDQEVFKPHKLTKYHEGFADLRKGTPVLFFVVAPKRRGAVNETVIGELEKFLIAIASRKNPRLLNVHGVPKPKFGIEGVLLAGKGKPPKASQEFKKCMGL